LYGGDDRFVSKLDAVLGAAPDSLPGSYGTVIHEMREAQDSGMGQYAHPNEPVHHMLYMYNYAGAPWKTQQAVRKVMSEASPFYSAGADGGGYLGDEDNGAMSAWYVFTALGLYPASPVHNDYAIGSPLFGRMTLHLENGRSFAVVAKGNAPDHVYVQSASLNGEPYSKNYISHEDVVNGGVLELQMGAAPSSWGSSRADRAPSMTADDALPSPIIDCAQAGVASASAENRASGENADAAFDDNSETKWLAFSNTASLQYRLHTGCAVELYTLTSANDAPERDPQDWVLEGSIDGTTWEQLDERHGEVFKWRRQTRVFPATLDKAYTNYRLTISRNHGGAALQLAEVELIKREPRTAAPTPAKTDATAPARRTGFAACAVRDCVGGKAGGIQGCMALLALICLVVTRRLLGPSK
jgi:hypothetical protein